MSHRFETTRRRHYRQNQPVFGGANYPTHTQTKTTDNFKRFLLDWRQMTQQYAIIIILIFIVFGSSLRNDFVFDDHEAVVKNQDLDFRIDFFSTELFKHDFWGKDILDHSSHKSYRPFTVLVWRLIRKFFGSIELNPFHFHFVNLLSYSVVCCYVYKTLQKLFNLFGKNDSETAFQIAILFAFHPVHCEPVSSCVGLADILSCLFWLISVNSFIKTKVFSESKWILTKWLAICIRIIFWTTISMLFKEQGITCLGFLIFLNIYSMFLRPTEKIYRYKMISTSLIFLIAVILLLYFRIWIMNFQNPIFGPLDNPSWHIKSPLMRYINYSYVHFLNILITICPIWLSFDWSMGCIRLIESFHDVRLIFVFLYWSGLVIFLVFLLTKPMLRYLVIFFALSVMTFLPSSNLFFPVGFVIAERNLFLPILGYLSIFVVLQKHLLDIFPKYYRILNLGLYLVMAMFAMKSFQRSLDWNDELALFEKDASVCPSNAKIFYNIAKVSADRGDKIKAKEHYYKAISLYENYTNALNNLANILKEENQLPEAKELLEKACHLEPKFATGWMNLATIEITLGNYETANYYLRKCVLLRPEHVLTHFNLGNLHLKQKKFEDAENDFKMTINLDPSFCKGWHNLVLLKQNLDQINEAYRLAREALSRHCPDDHSLHFLIANILGQKENYFQAEDHYKEAIRLKPNNAAYLYNLAVLYHRKREYSSAIQYYRETLRFNPQNRNARKNLQQLENGFF